MPKSKARFLLKAVLSVILNGILFDGVKNLFPALYKGEILRGVYPERSLS